MEGLHAATTACITPFFTLRAPQLMDAEPGFHELPQCTDIRGTPFSFRACGARLLSLSMWRRFIGFALST